MRHYAEDEDDHDGWDEPVMTILNHMELHYKFFSAAVSKALSFMLAEAPAQILRTVDYITRAERIDWLEELIVDKPYRHWAQADLDVCRHADKERSRILRKLRDGKKVYLYELTEVMDLVGSAAYGLDETMSCEADGYVAVDLPRL